MVISSSFDKSLEIEFVKQLSRKISPNGNLTLFYALYEISFGTTVYAVAVSDGNDLSYCFFDKFSAAEELFSTAIDSGLDAASLDAVADDMFSNNML